MPQSSTGDPKPGGESGGASSGCWVFRLERLDCWRRGRRSGEKEDAAPSGRPPDSPSRYGSVNAEAGVAAISVWDCAAEAGSVAAGHRRLHRQLARHVVRGAEIGDGIEHRGRATGVNRRGARVIAFEHLGEQVGDVSLVTDVAVLRDQPHLAAGEEVVQATRMGLVAKAEQDACGDVLGGEVPAQDREGGDADAAADEDRACRIRR